MKVIDRMHQLEDNLFKLTKTLPEVLRAYADECEKNAQLENKIRSSERIEFEAVMRKNGFPDTHLRKDRKGNYHWRNLKGRTLLSAEGRKYKNDVVYAVYDQLKKKPVPITGNVAVKIEFYPPDNRTRDMDNYYKALFDSLTTAGVWIDDSQIKRI